MDITRVVLIGLYLVGTACLITGAAVVLFFIPARSEVEESARWRIACTLFAVSAACAQIAILGGAEHGLWFS